MVAEDVDAVVEAVQADDLAAVQILVPIHERLLIEVARAEVPRTTPLAVIRPTVVQVQIAAAETAAVADVAKQGANPSRLGDSPGLQH